MEVDPTAPDEEGGPYCGAKRQRGYEGFCKQPAGLGTHHVGEGRCYLHGGRGDAVPTGALEATPFLAQRTRRLSLEDAEALMTMGTVAMVLARAELMGRLISGGITTKEANDITLSVTRLDALLGKHPELTDPEQAKVDGQAIGGVNLDDELKRLLELEQGN